MRYEQTVTVVCDGCGKRATGTRQCARVLTPMQRGRDVQLAPNEMGRVVVPSGWVITVLTPDVALARPSQPEPFGVSAVEWVRETGLPCEAAFCEPCRLTRNLPAPRTVIDVEAEAPEGEKGLVTL